jgi:hypothetical protein
MESAKQKGRTSKVRPVEKWNNQRDTLLALTSLAGRSNYAGGSAIRSILGLPWHFNSDWLEFGSVKHIVFALDLGGLLRGSLGLNHLGASFKDRALFDHQRRRLNVATQFRSPAQLNPLAGDDVAVHHSMNCGD